MNPTQFDRMFRFLPSALVLACACSFAQAHRQSAGGYTVQASTTSTMDIAAAAALKQGIQRDPRKAILNVTVIDSKGRTVHAELAVDAINLAGIKSRIPMKPTPLDGWISYTGVYPHLEQEVLDFVILTRPEKSAQWITLRFRDRMPVR